MNLHIPPAPLNISRKDMPQIQAKDVDEFLNVLRRKGIRLDRERVEVGTLKPTQSEFNHDKVKGMMKFDLSKSKPIIISMDNYIMDGHHRWLADLNKNRHLKIDTIRVHLKIMDLIQEAKSFDKVFYKKIHEQQAVKTIKRVITETYEYTNFLNNHKVIGKK